MESNWIDQQVSLYRCNSDNTGRPASYRNILLTQFAIKHNWWWYDKQTNKNHKGTSNDLKTIIELKRIDPNDPDKKKKTGFKNTLQCYTPAALLQTKKKNMVKEISRPGIMQLDFDYNDIKDYDVEELKQCVFKLPFIGFCGLSCSGYGFYALALIAEPERLSEYAEHCFEVLKTYGIKPDETKGKKPENLRYLSYDCNMLIKENPEPLRIKHFKTKQAINSEPAGIPTQSYPDNNSARLKAGLRTLQTMQKGDRWETVKRVAYTIGGLGEPGFVDDIKQAIKNNPAFKGEEEKYIGLAKYCFDNGMKAPF